MLLRQLPSRLPAGEYRLTSVAELDPTLAATAFALGGYVFDRYKRERGREAARLVAPDGADAVDANRIARAAALAGAAGECDDRGQRHAGENLGTRREHGSAFHSVDARRKTCAKNYLLEAEFTGSDCEMCLNARLISFEICPRGGPGAELRDDGD